MSKTIKEAIYNVSDIFRRSFPYEIYIDMCTYCVFLKYILDNEKLPYDKVSFDLQRMFYTADADGEIMLKASYTIEEKYNLPKSSLADFAQTFIKFNNLRQSTDTSSQVFNILKEIDFSGKGREIIDALNEVLYSSASNFGVLLGERITSKSLSKLIKKLTAIHSSDSYADFAYGIGISTLEIIGEADCQITGYEINRSSVAMAGMLLIISGHENFNLVMGDSLELQTDENCYDKIVFFPPLGAKCTELKPAYTKLMQKFGLPAKRTALDVLMLLKALTALKNDGRCFMTVTPGFLFSNTVTDRAVRKLITQKHLKAVIQLPNMYYGTRVQTVLLILEKQKAADTVIFVDGSSNEYFGFTDKLSRSVSSLTEKGIDKILEAVNEMNTVDGISKVATNNEIEKNNYLLTPSKYIKSNTNEARMPTREIDKRLKQLYNELKELMEEQR